MLNMTIPRKRMAVKTRRILHDGKTKWITLGSAFVVNDEQINIVLDSIPVWNNWDGSLVVFLDDKEES